MQSMRSASTAWSQRSPKAPGTPKHDKPWHPLFVLVCSCSLVKTECNGNCDTSFGENVMNSRAHRKDFIDVHRLLEIDEILPLSMPGSRLDSAIRFVTEAQGTTARQRNSYRNGRWHWVKHWNSWLKKIAAQNTITVPKMTLVLPLGMLSFRTLACVLVCVVWNFNHVEYFVLWSTRTSLWFLEIWKTHRKFLGDFQKARLIHGA